MYKIYATPFSSVDASTLMFSHVYLFIFILFFYFFITFLGWFIEGSIGVVHGPVRR